MTQTRRDNPVAAPRNWAVVTICLVLLLASQRPAFGQQTGYWKAKGEAEFWDSHVPPKGPATSVVNGFRTTYEIKSGYVRYSAGAVNNPRYREVGETTWGTPPPEIYPGEPIPVAGTAKVVEFSAGDSGAGVAVTLLCQAGFRTKAPNGDDAISAAGLLFGMEGGKTKRAHTASKEGPAVLRVDYRNAEASYGSKGRSYAGRDSELCVVYTSIGASYSPRVAYCYTWIGGSKTSLQGIWVMDNDHTPDGRLVSTEAPWPVDFTGSGTVTGRYTNGQPGVYNVEAGSAAAGATIVLNFTSGSYKAVFTGKWQNADTIEGSYKDSRGGGGDFRLTRKR